MRRLESTDEIPAKRATADGQILDRKPNWSDSDGRNNWMFAGLVRAGQRAAAVMNLIQSAKLNGHDAQANLKDVLTSLPMYMNSRIGELLPQRWTAV